MKATAILLALALSSAPAASTSTSAPGLSTPLERELWHAVVLLEGDVETATTARASCEQALNEALVVPEASPVHVDDQGPGWVTVAAGVALGITSGLVIGLLIDKEAL